MANNRSPANLKLSILDGVGISKGETATEALQNSTEVAKLADRLGYTRLWYTEHHNSKHQLSTSPDLLSAHFAAFTQRIRIGAGGIMLPNHSPLRVAENFSILEALHPGRIDLGMGRASGTDGITAFALNRANDPAGEGNSLQQLYELLAYFTGEFPDEHQFANIAASPDPSIRPEFFMLGSSKGGMQIAAQFGMGFAFAAQINPGVAVPVLRTYRERFRPSQFRQQPYSILSIIVICAETDEEAQYFAEPAQLQWARWGTGQIHLPPPTTEEADAHVYSPAEQKAKREGQGRFIVGNPTQVKAQLEQLAADAQVDELMVVNMIFDHPARMKSYELLADVFDLAP